MANFRRKHPVGKPQLRSKSSDYKYINLERGTYKRGHASTRRRLESAEARRG